METIKKLGKVKTFNHTNGKIIVGTVNSIDCKSIYIILETWITVKESLETSIGAIRRRFIANRYNLSNIYFNDVKTSLIDYDYAWTEKLDKPNKKSFISIEITLLSKNRFVWDKDLIFNSEAFGDNCFSLLDSLSQHFDMSVSK